MFCEIQSKLFANSLKVRLILRFEIQLYICSKAGQLIPQKIWGKIVLGAVAPLLLRSVSWSVCQHFASQ